jgi:hypothetical protein
MQANSLTDNPKEAAEQQANFIMLRALEEKVPPDMFNQVLQSVTLHVPLTKFEYRSANHVIFPSESTGKATSATSNSRNSRSISPKLIKIICLNW